MNGRASNLPEHEPGPDDRDRQRAPERRADKPEPAQHDEGGTEQADEQPVAAGGVEAEDAAAGMAAGAAPFQKPHQRDRAEDEDEEGGGRPGPSHP